MWNWCARPGKRESGNCFISRQWTKIIIHTLDSACGTRYNWCNCQCGFLSTSIFFMCVGNLYKFYLRLFAFYAISCVLDTTNARWFTRRTFSSNNFAYNNWINGLLAQFSININKSHQETHQLYQFFNKNIATQHNSSKYFLARFVVSLSSKCITSVFFFRTSDDNN